MLRCTYSNTSYDKKCCCLVVLSSLIMLYVSTKVHLTFNKGKLSDKNILLIIVANVDVCLSIISESFP